MSSQDVIEGVVGLSRRQIEGQYIAPAHNRQGAAISVNWLLQLAIEGKTFHAQQGDAATHVHGRDDQRDAA